MRINFEQAMEKALKEEVEHILERIGSNLFLTEDQQRVFEYIVDIFEIYTANEGDFNAIKHLPKIYPTMIEASKAAVDDFLNTL